MGFELMNFYFIFTVQIWECPYQSLTLLDPCDSQQENDDGNGNKDNGDYHVS